jgi:hypothetical protein
MDYRRASRRTENRVAKKLRGKRVPLSGGGEGFKGDVLTEEFLVECKNSFRVDAKGEKTFELKKDFLEKAAKEAKLMGKPYWCLYVHYAGDKQDYVVLPADLLFELVRQYRAYREQAEAQGA